MKRILKTIGATTALGTLILAAQPALALPSDQGAKGQTTTEQSSHGERHQKMHGSGQSGMMGQMGGGMGHMSGHGSGHMEGNFMNSHSAEKDLSAQDVKKIIEGRLAWSGNKRLKVGEVKKKDDDTYTADIVTIDNSLVERVEVDRKTGATRQAK